MIVTQARGVPGERCTQISCHHIRYDDTAILGAKLSRYHTEQGHSDVDHENHLVKRHLSFIQNWHSYAIVSFSQSLRS
jgi:hypothetical protein